MKILEPLKQAMIIEKAWAEPNIQYYIQSLFLRFSELLYSQWLDRRRTKNGAPLLTNQHIELIRDVISSEVPPAFVEGNKYPSRGELR